MSWLRGKSEQDPAPEREPTVKAIQPPGSPREKRMEKLVNIGQSVQIKGELSGNEDLTIEGSVDGKIMLKDHNLTIGANGRINAEIHAKTVLVVGQVTGNVTATDRVEIGETGKVNGDVRAPRVAIADGAQFKGSIDMERSGAATTSTVRPSSGVATHGGPNKDSIPRSAGAMAER